MKRVATFALALLILCNFIVSAAPGDVIEEQTGIDPGNIPTDLESAKEGYLKQNWQELIEKNAVLGKAHAFFLKISFLFQILFGQPYSLSPRLFFIILLWIYLVTKIDSALFSFGLLNRPAQAAIAIGSGIILAQVHALSFIVGKVADLLFAPEGWIMRIIAMAITAGIAILIHFIINKGIQSLKKSRKDAEDIEKTESVQEMKAFLKGVEEGQSLDKN